MTFDDVKKWLMEIGGFGLQAFPAASYFMGVAPPFFPQLGLLVTVLGLAVVYWARKREANTAPLERRNVVMLLFAILLISGYWVTLQYCTVLPPHGRTGVRKQIGFYMSEWSLTGKAKLKAAELLKESPPIEINTPNDFMNVFGVWGGQGRTDEIWEFWSILSAGFLLSALFVGGFCVWAYAVGMLLHQLPKKA